MTVICLIYFLVVFLAAAIECEHRRLVAGARAGLAGSILFLLLHLLVIMNFVIHYRFNWLSQISQWVFLATMPVVIAATAALLFFFFTIWKNDAIPLRGQVN